MTNIFKSDETYESAAASQKPTRAAQDMSETDRMTPPPGLKKYPGHDVEHVMKARRGYTTY